MGREQHFVEVHNASLPRCERGTSPRSFVRGSWERIGREKLGPPIWSKCNPKSSRQPAQECIITRHKNNHRPLENTRVAAGQCVTTTGRRTHNSKIPIDLWTPTTLPLEDVRQFFRRVITPAWPPIVKMFAFKYKARGVDIGEKVEETLWTVSSKFEEERAGAERTEPAIFEIV